MPKTSTKMILPEPNAQWRINLRPVRKYADLPDLLELQKKWFNDFVNYYLPKLFADVCPIEDIAGEKLIITIDNIKVEEPTNDIAMCKKKELTYGGIISGKIKLTDRVSWKDIYNKHANIGILPLMTPAASYIINGVERVMISQIVRSYGIFYNQKDLKYGFKLIPERGPWLEVSIEKSWNVVARVNKSRKFVITSLLRAFGFETDESIRALFQYTLEEEDTNYVEFALAKDPSTDALSAAEYIYGKIRPGELIDRESALDYIKSQFLDANRILVWRIARRKINAKLDLNVPLDSEQANVYDVNDFVASIKYLVSIANQKKGFYIDDADHSANKRIRTMGEILGSHLQPVMRKFTKSVKGKLSVLNLDEPIKMTSLVNFKIIDTSLKSFFATSQLSQFLDQINPLAEVEHKRRITALGPGWLKRETAKFDVRDVHPSHYGRICPIETPEWQNIGLVLYQALYSRVNNEWFLETPALKMYHEALSTEEELVNKIARSAITTKDEKTILVEEWAYITQEAAKKIAKEYKGEPVRVKAYFNPNDIEFISPEYDEKTYIADVTTAIDEHNNILRERIPGRHFNRMELFHTKDITHIDVNPSQIFSANTALMPFVNHNDAVRAMMGTNQQRQGLPLIKNDAPLIGTWLEADILKMTHAVITAEEEWEVIYVDGKRVKVKYKKGGIKEYKLSVFMKSNQKSIIHQRALVSPWQKVKKGDLLAEGPCAENGELAVGKNIRVGYMSREWYNYEDAIVISQRLVKNDALTSIHIEEFEIEVSDTKLGAEETTNDIPWVSLQKLANLASDGIVRVWSFVKWWDILVGKITPKSEGDLTPEEKLIQAIFGDKSKSLKDTSLYMPSWSEWKVIDIVVLDSKNWDNLLAWVRKKVKVYVASTRKIEVWDKLSAKHANKWIISAVVAEEDMPFTADGESIDIVLNPLWVISRMNLWQLFETQMWLIAKTLGVKFSVPTFSGVGVEDIRKLADLAWLPADLKLPVFDGRSGQKFPNNITVGYLHVMKLNHMVEDKIHARSVWPYSLITQQPLGGKAREGWQRFGEMEVRALEAYSAVYTLQEMLTIKSDDIVWRNKTYEAIIRGNAPQVVWLPESFHYLVYLFKWLGQDINPLTQDQINELHRQRTEKIMKLGLAGITGDRDQEADVVSNETEDKLEIMENVIEELQEYEDINEDD